MKAEHGLYKGGTASDFISVKNREIGPAKRPCPGRQQPWARPRAGSASQQIQAGGTLRFALRRLRAPQPDPTPWTEPCSLLAPSPTSVVCPTLFQKCAPELMDSVHCRHLAALCSGIMIHITNLQGRVASPKQNLCLSSSPGIKSPPEVTEDAKSPVAACLLGFTEQ